MPGAFTSQLLYIVAEDAGPGSSLFRLEKSAYDGARPQVLLESGEPIMSPSWSPNGQDVAYVSFETGLPRIYIQNIASGQRRQITNYPNINSSPVYIGDALRIGSLIAKV